MCSAAVVAVLYGTLVAVLWQVALVKLDPADQLAIAGPLTLIATLEDSARSTGADSALVTAMLPSALICNTIS